MNRWTSTPALIGLAFGSGTVLTTGTPNAGELARGLSAPHRWIALVGPDAAVASLAEAVLWLIALWIAVCLGLSTAALAPGRAGALAHAIASRVTPAALRRVVATAAGASILLSPATALATPAAPPAAGATATLPAIGWPTDSPSGPAQPGHTPMTRDTSEHAVGRSPDSSAGRLTVRAGDSLWSIAARRLGAHPSAARVQQEWPRWYAANRQLIGTDPDLIRPGTRLAAPGPGPAHTDRTRTDETRTDETRTGQTPGDRTRVDGTQVGR